MVKFSRHRCAADGESRAVSLRRADAEADAAVAAAAAAPPAAVGVPMVRYGVEQRSGITPQSEKVNFPSSVHLGRPKRGTRTSEFVNGLRRQESYTAA